MSAKEELGLVKTSNFTCEPNANEQNNSFCSFALGSAYEPFDV